MEKHLEASEASGAAATCAAASTTAHFKLAESLALSAEAWTAVKRAGACACCAARLAGCREIAAYDCDERDLRAQLEARFTRQLPTAAAAAAAASAAEKSTAACGGLGGGGGGGGTGMSTCCTLCLGLLQAEVPLRMAPRGQPSSETHGDDNRSCVTGPLMPAQEPRSPKQKQAEQLGEAGSADDAAADESQATTEEVLPEPTPPPPLPVTSGGARHDNNAPEATAAGTGQPGLAGGDSYLHARMAESIASCAKSRGYTVSSFGINAAVPACLAVRDAAFAQAYGGLLRPDAKINYSRTGTDTVGVAVSVKEALKLGLTGALRECFGGVPCDGDASDFVVEVTAKSLEADAHAMEMLLGGPKLSQGGAKPPGWPGGGRWAKKRQRREEHRNPGLTVGAVKKGLAALDDEGRARMKRWAEGLGSGGPGGGVAEGGGGGAGGGGGGGGAGEGVAGSAGGSDSGSRGSEGDGKGDEAGGNTEGMDVEAEGDADGASRTAAANGNGKNNDVHGVAADVASAALTPPASESNKTATSMAARCEIAMHRQPVHFWGRYTKLSRAVPQTPWFRGYYSVQEAVSEPFEKFSGCVEGLLHGAGREDVDVRMLGNGRPFCLELVDSLRSGDEIAAELPAMSEAINAAAGSKNVGGGVAVSRLRVAGSGDLPSDVQKVGEGKRKHYRCVVWVSRKVGPEELRVMCDRGELVVQQSTPVRVLHRRTLLDRPRSVFDMRAEWINDHFFVLELTTSAGTYIKEFVHGDLGRTSPSVGLLLNCKADILQLDVTDVEDRWSSLEAEEERGAQATAVCALGATDRAHDAESTASGAVKEGLVAVIAAVVAEDGLRVGGEGGTEGEALAPSLL